MVLLHESAFIHLKVFFLGCSENVVLLPNGLHAYVIFIWQKICWADYPSDPATQRRALF